ncbi:MAG TPA: ATPase domain-containing protein [Rickettsiales bacterium]|nr:ATPase domain-containing protein [Rickettsiales bacterium]
MPNNHATNIRTGSAELDDILGGGLPANRVYLLHGTPGAGKTTLAMQFLIEGAKNGEKVLYITLSETKQELMATAKSHGWDLSGIEIFEMIAQEADLQPENQYTMYQPSEIELSETTKAIIGRIETIKPARCVIDSLAEVKLLAQNLLRYRRQVLALKQFFIGRNCTTFFLDDKTALNHEDKQLESIAHGVISLEQLSPEYGSERRRLRITKLRGQKYRGGYHDFNIVRGGLAIFPRLVASEHAQAHGRTYLKSGISELDNMLGGGIEYGASMLLIGPAGSGKSSLAVQYALSVAEAGERAAIFTFDERMEMLIQRAEGMSQPVRKYVKSGHITIQAIDPVEMSPGEFAHTVRQATQDADGQSAARVVVIDSLNGYLNSMPEEHFLTAQLHELLTYLGHKNIVTILVVAQHGLLGNAMNTPIDTSYLADSVVLFRYFEAHGEVRQTISILKKRMGEHERSIREFKIESGGLRVGEKLHKFQGILTGTPVFVGEDERLMKTA